jgi:hypothetical protein
MEPTRGKARRGRPPGKRSDPDCVQISAYIRRTTHNEVHKKLAALGKKDFSLLVEGLLNKWLERPVGSFSSHIARANMESTQEFHKRLLLELRRRRKEAEVKYKGNWVPDQISKMDLVYILD